MTAKYLLIVERQRTSSGVTHNEEWTLDSYSLEELATILQEKNYDSFIIYEVVGKTQRNKRKKGISAIDLAEILTKVRE